MNPQHAKCTPVLPRQKNLGLRNLGKGVRGTYSLTIRSIPVSRLHRKRGNKEYIYSSYIRRSLSNRPPCSEGQDCSSRDGASRVATGGSSALTHSLSLSRPCFEVSWTDRLAFSWPPAQGRAGARAAACAQPLACAQPHWQCAPGALRFPAEHATDMSPFAFAWGVPRPPSLRTCRSLALAGQRWRSDFVRLKRKVSNWKEDGLRNFCPSRGPRHPKAKAG